MRNVFEFFWVVSITDVGVGFHSYRNAGIWRICDFALSTPASRIAGIYTPIWKLFLLARRKIATHTHQYMITVVRVQGLKTIIEILKGQALDLLFTGEARGNHETAYLS